MDTSWYGMIGYQTAAVAYSLLAFYLLFFIKKSQVIIPFLLASLVSALWAGICAYILQANNLFLFNALPYEALRDAGWFYLLSVLISRQQFDSPYQFLRQYWQPKAMLLFLGVVCVCEFFPELLYWVQQRIGFDFRPFVHLFLAICGLVLIEQLFRSTPPEQRWNIKFLSIALAGSFVFDFILYSNALLFAGLDFELWEARGIVHSLLSPLLLVSVNRLSKNPVRISVSKQLFFHTSVLVGAGVYLLLMSLMGYYIRDYGGDWGRLAQIGFIVLAIVLLLVFFVSGKARALAKVYFSKHFFQHRYDYREQWIKLSHTLAQLKSLDEVACFIVKTLADLVESSGGGIWLKNAQGDYVLNEEFNLGFEPVLTIKRDDPLIQFFALTPWVIDFVEFSEAPEVYQGAELERWQAQSKDIWLIVPLFLQNELKALVMLTKPRVPRKIDWQDHDLLKTVGMQLANALALTQASEELSRARQFEAFNRLSAFLVHDLKNLIAQIAMIVKNAEKHKHNPEFIDDSIETLENVVNKMQRILKQLKAGGQQANEQQVVDLVEVAHDALAQLKQNTPAIEFVTAEGKLLLQGDRNQLNSVFVHLLQNAQDATPDHGWVKMQLEKSGDNAILTIQDNGCGMDETFIKQRLFRPFDTTKGNAGMGIGVYEAREYIEQHGGHIGVDSAVGKGTTFTVQFPLYNESRGK